MAKEWARWFYNSKEWLECRAGYIQSVHGLCETCLAKGIIKPGKIVHHTITLTPENIYDPEITLNWDYLKHECQDCHNAEPHGREEKRVTREGLIFDEHGNLIEE